MLCTTIRLPSLYSENGGNTDTVFQQNVSERTDYLEKQIQKTEIPTLLNGVGPIRFYK